MHFHLPKPLHGWREFVGEVGIIVLGVLIALGAEQAVEGIHWHGEVKETRSALDAELAHDLSSFTYRMSIEPCARRRLNELDLILARQDQAIVKLNHDLEPPITINLEFAVWDAASGEARSLIPLQPKLQYAHLYDTLRHYQSLRDRESVDWNQLADVDFNARLSDQELKQAKATVKRLRRLDAILFPGFELFIRRWSEPLAIRPDDTDIPAPVRDELAKNRATLCSPLI